MLKIIKTELEGVLILEHNFKQDNRGSSAVIYSEDFFKQAGIKNSFVEELIYRTEKKSTLYGIHFQNKPKSQGKLIRCAAGSGLDYVVDLRRESKTYKKWICTEISRKNRKLVYVPRGYGHAFLTTEDNTEVIMKIDEYFVWEYNRAISYKDPELNIGFDISDPVLSERDRNAPFLKDSDCNL